MRRSFLFVTAMMTACGSRTEIRDAPAFAVVYVEDFTHLARWHSATGAVDVLPTTLEPFDISCTRDGRFIALSDLGFNGPLEILDQSGAVVRSQTGIVEAIRPDGARVIVSNARPSDWPNDCVGTLDADGTYGNAQCWPDTTPTSTGAADYSPDGVTVLWRRAAFQDGIWTLATARENGDEWHPIASGTSSTLGPAAWSPDGARVAFTTSRFEGGAVLSKISMVRVDTLELETILDDDAWVESFGFTPDGRDIVFLEGTVIDGNLVGSMAVRMIDLGTHAVIPLEVGVLNLPWFGLCVTRD